MYLRTPTATPLIGVLLVVFVAVSTDLRLLSIEVPRALDGGYCGPPEDRVPELRVALRPDLSATIRSARVTAETGPGTFAQLLRTALDAYTPDDEPELASPIVINVEADDEVRWGDLVSTFDTMRGVAPDAHIALVSRRELADEDWR